MYVLAGREPALSSPAFRPLQGLHALVGVLTNTYAHYLLTPEQRAAELHLLTRLVAHVPVREIRCPEDPRRLPALCQAIVDDFTSLRAPPSGNLGPCTTSSATAK